MKIKKRALMIASLSVLFVQSCSLDGQINLPLPLPPIPINELKELINSNAEIRTFMEIANLVNNRGSVAILANGDVYFFENAVSIVDKEYAKKFYRDGFVVTEAVIITKSELSSYKIGSEVKDLYVSDSKQINIFLEKGGFNMKGLILALFLLTGACSTTVDNKDKVSLVKDAVIEKSLIAVKPKTVLLEFLKYQKDANGIYTLSFSNLDIIIDPKNDQDKLISIVDLRKNINFISKSKEGDVYKIGDVGFTNIKGVFYIKLENKFFKLEEVSKEQKASLKLKDEDNGFYVITSFFDKEIISTIDNLFKTDKPGGVSIS